MEQERKALAQAIRALCLYIDLVGQELRRLEAGATPPDTWLPVDSALGGLELVRWLRSRLVPLDRSLEYVACDMGSNFRDHELPVTVLRLEDESCVGEVVGRVDGGRKGHLPDPEPGYVGEPLRGACPAGAGCHNQAATKRQRKWGRCILRQGHRMRGRQQAAVLSPAGRCAKSSGPW